VCGQSILTQHKPLETPLVFAFLLPWSKTTSFFFFRLLALSKMIFTLLLFSFSPLLLAPSKKNALLQFCFFFSFYASKSILFLLLHVPNSIMFSTLPCAKFHSFFFLFLPCAKFHSQKLSTPGLPRGRRKFSTPSLSRGKHFLFIFNSLIIIFFKKIHLILDYLNIL